MSESIIKRNRKGVCFICKRYAPTEEHHIFGGGNRKKADKDGLTVYLCHNCHNEAPSGAHYNKAVSTYLKQVGERAWCEHYGKTIEDFIKEYGGNYL